MSIHTGTSAARKLELPKHRYHACFVLPCKLTAFGAGALVKMPMYKSLGSQRLRRHVKGDVANAR